MLSPLGALSAAEMIKFALMVSAQPPLAMPTRGSIAGSIPSSDVAHTHSLLRPDGSRNRSTSRAKLDLPTTTTFKPSRSEVPWRQKSFASACPGTRTRYVANSSELEPCAVRPHQTGAPQCSFVEYRGMKVIYRRYASLFFIVGTDSEEEVRHATQTRSCFCTHTACFDRMSWAFWNSSTRLWKPWTSISRVWYALHHVHRASRLVAILIVPLHLCPTNAV